MLRQTWQASAVGPSSAQGIAAGAGALAAEAQAVRAVEEWLLAYFDTQLGIHSRAIDPAAPFSCYGLRSIQSMCLVMDLADWLGCALPPTVITEYPTIRALATYAAYHSS